MSRDDARLRREIYAIVIIKLVVIFGLWWAFIRDAQVEVDQERLAEHLATPAAPVASPRQSGEPDAQ